jgi:hypothetical protein
MTGIGMVTGSAASGWVIDQFGAGNAFPENDRFQEAGGQRRTSPSPIRQGRAVHG